MASSNGGSWQQLTSRLAAADAPLAEALLELAGATSIAVAGDRGEEVLEPAPGTTPLWSHVEVRAIFPASADLAPLIAVLDDAIELSSPPTVDVLREQQWLHPTFPLRRVRRFGRLRVSGSQGTPAAPGVTLKLNMGLAFGTGDHPTTALCLDWLEEHVRPGMRVLDYGCGSGILALAALVLGAGHAWAADIEPQALVATEANARLNGLLDRLWIGAPERLPKLTADVVVANILAAPLLGLLERFARYLRAGGYLVMSGVLVPELRALEAALAPHFEAIRTDQRAGWARLACRRAGSVRR